MSEIWQKEVLGTRVYEKNEGLQLSDFEFLLGMNIWYDILFVVNSVSRILQSKDMHIDVAIDHLKY